MSGVRRFGWMGSTVCFGERTRLGIAALLTTVQDQHDQTVCRTTGDRLFDECPLGTDAHIRRAEGGLKRRTAEGERRFDPLKARAVAGP